MGISILVILLFCKVSPEAKAASGDFDRAKTGTGILKKSNVCTHNSHRSQMAEGFTQILGEGKVAVATSGLAASEVDPVTVKVMAEIGIDISNQTSKPLSDFNADDYSASHLREVHP